jgi:hypothetical protein
MSHHKLFVEIDSIPLLNGVERLSDICFKVSGNEVLLFYLASGTSEIIVLKLGNNCGMEESKLLFPIEILNEMLASNYTLDSFYPVSDDKLLLFFNKVTQTCFENKIILCNLKENTATILLDNLCNNLYCIYFV